jgi:anti-anti-sigma regulatory factor
MEMVRDGQAWRLSIADAVALTDVVALHGLALGGVTGDDVIVDLGEAGHLHAAAIQVLLALATSISARGNTLVIRATSAAARDALALAGLSRWTESA